MSDDRTIPQRELRNNVAGVLREVAAGARVRVTVRGRAVAELIPVTPRPIFASRSDVIQIIEGAPLDPSFSGDVDAVIGATIEEL